MQNRNLIKHSKRVFNGNLVTLHKKASENFLNFGYYFPDVFAF